MLTWPAWLMQSLRADLACEWSEVPVVAGTRLVLGPGGQLLQLLLAGKALQLELRGFAPGSQPDTALLRAALERHGQVSTHFLFGLQAPPL